MSKQWKRQAIAAMAAMVVILGAAGAYSAATIARYMPRAQAQETAAPFAAKWGTVIQTAATHTGPGLRYPMNGRIAAGHGVEVVRMQDGWYKCLTYLSAEPVWVSGEYVVLID